MLFQGLKEVKEEQIEAEQQPAEAPEGNKKGTQGECVIMKVQQLQE